MLFNSYIFIFAFMPVALGGFFLLGALSQRTAAAFLAVASLVFYGWWDVRFVPVLLLSIAWNYAWARIIASAISGGGGAVRVCLTVAIAGDLLLLGYFKYTGFFASVIDQVLETSLGPVSILLPLGISFFTFTQIAFLVDTARGEVHDMNPLRYLLFVTYFPHLIAGPILHHKEMMPQFAISATYTFDARNFATGLAYFSIGLAKKCLLADGFGPDAAFIFGAAAQGIPVGALAAWKGVLAFTLQLYFDFSGYIDMAVGLSLMLNVRLPLNFNSPYQSENIISFWRNWHMTLSRFLRDYLYIPLGGNRRGPARRYLNLFVTMVLGGFWHGANWTFVLWGALHGAYLGINHAWQSLRARAGVEMTSPLWRVPAVALTFLCIMVAWVFFRAQDVPTALRILRGLIGLNGAQGLSPPLAYSDFELFINWFRFPLSQVWLITVILYVVGLTIVLLCPNSQQIVERSRFAITAPWVTRLGWLQWRPTVSWAVLCGAMSVTALLTFTKVSEFLYFQF